MSNLVTIKTSSVANDLYIAKTYLEDNGITCFIHDELVNRAYPISAGGVKLRIAEEDAIRAAGLLVEGGFAKKEDFEIPEYTMRMVKIYESIMNFFKKKK